MGDLGRDRQKGKGAQNAEGKKDPPCRVAKALTDIERNVDLCDAQFLAAAADDRERDPMDDIGEQNGAGDGKTAKIKS